MVKQFRAAVSRGAHDLMNYQVFLVAVYKQGRLKNDRKAVNLLDMVSLKEKVEG
jgi:hypothetical protein